jgi:RHS repeat-associated protein
VRRPTGKPTSSTGEAFDAAFREWLDLTFRHRARAHVERTLRRTYQQAWLTRSARVRQDVLLYLARARLEEGKPLMLADLRSRRETIRVHALNAANMYILRGGWEPDEKTISAIACIVKSDVGRGFRLIAFDLIRAIRDPTTIPMLESIAASDLDREFRLDANLELLGRGQPFRFTGEQQDAEVARDLYYLRARYYDPEIGRFWSKDPFAGWTVEAQSLNRYPYVLNNPVRWVDPTGLACDDDLAPFSGWDTTPGVSLGAPTVWGGRGARGAGGRGGRPPQARPAPVNPSPRPTPPPVPEPVYVPPDRPSPPGLPPHAGPQYLPLPPGLPWWAYVVAGLGFGSAAAEQAGLFDLLSDGGDVAGDKECGRSALCSRQSSW